LRHGGGFKDETEWSRSLTCKCERDANATFLYFFSSLLLVDGFGNEADASWENAEDAENASIERKKGRRRRRGK
jgi:hypothetical protein